MMMKRFFNRLSIVAFVGIFGLGLMADVAAQRPNAREVRDLVRSLNAKVEDLGYNLTDQMRSRSQSQQTIEDARTAIDDLTSAIKAFEDNLSQRRENRSDIQDIVSAAQNLNSMVLGTGQNRMI
jgi:septal ring factor EnvC (AmiA/AmiB activator)